MGIISSAKAAVDCTMFIMNMLFFLGGGSVLALGAYMVSSAQWAAVYGSGINVGLGVTPASVPPCRFPAACGGDRVGLCCRWRMQATSRAL